MSNATPTTGAFPHSYGAVGFVDERHFANGDLDTTTHMLLVKADTDQVRNVR